MNTFLKRLMMNARLMKPADDDTGAGGAGGAAVDRGDNFVPSDEAVAAEAAAAEAAKDTAKADADAARIAAELGKKDGLAAGKEAGKEAPAAGAGEGEGEGDKDEKRKDTRIPLARHEAVLARERAAREAAEVELEKVRKGQAATAVATEVSKLKAQVDEKEEKYAELLADGKTKEATAVMREIRALERDITTQEAEARTQAATADAVETVRFDAVVERLEAAYPQLKPGHDEFDEKVVGEVLEMQSAFVAKGYAPSAALQKAVGYVIRPETAKQETATSVTPRVTAEEAAAAATKDARATEQRKKNAAAADGQPPALNNAGANSDAAGGVLDAKTVIKMPFDKFSKLSEEEISRLRGDTV